MAYGELRKRGIYCLETVYEPTDKTSVRGLLEVLNSCCDAPYVHRDAATTTEFHSYLEEWLTNDSDEYPILYLGFHGSEDGKSDLVNHEVISERLSGRCRNRAVHFGACGALKGINTRCFLEETGASAVSGYRTDMDWMQSAAFDLLFLEELQYHGGKSLTPSVARQAKHNLMGTDQPYAKMRTHLGFHILTA